MNTTVHNEQLEYTGERMVPEAADEYTFWQHILRYRFAIPYIQNKRVLDIACGEGYGTAAMLKAGAASVVGVDIDAESCQHARRKYGIDTRIGDAQNIPLPDNSVDVVVSFETIEHVDSPQKFIEECVRVLAPGGMVVVSTPNRDVFQAYFREIGNPFHISELSEEEFVALLKQHFSSLELYQQFATRYPVRGMGRLYRKMMPARYRSPHAMQEARNAPCEAITDRRTSLFDGCVIHDVRKPSFWQGTEPLYWIAVARL